MGVVHGQSQLGVWVRLFFHPSLTEAWKMLGRRARLWRGECVQSLLFSFILLPSFSSLDPLIHIVSPSPNLGTGHLGVDVSGSLRTQVSCEGHKAGLTLLITKALSRVTCLLFPSQTVPWTYGTHGIVGLTEPPLGHVAGKTWTLFLLGVFSPQNLQVSSPDMFHICDSACNWVTKCSIGNSG